MPTNRRAGALLAGRYNEIVLRVVFTALLAVVVSSPAQTGFFPLKDIRPGMHGTGRTVFSGNRIEEFQVEILGVLENIGPKQSLILARLSGGPLEHTGVMQGMSGSPVYIDGRLAGAVAMAFPFSKDPIAGIRPIEDMVKVSPTAASPPTPRRASNGAGGTVALADRDVIHALPKPEALLAGDSRMVDIATPVNFGGFTRSALEAFAPQLRNLGLEPRQGVTSGAKIQPGMGNPADLKPGSMISVQLMAGDMSVGADGTVTHIDSGRVYAFGHRFLAVGSTSLPFARAEVITLLPNVNTSFKLSSAKEWMGTINRDGDTAVAGELGKRAGMAPVSISVAHDGRPVDTYQMQMVDDPLLSLLIQMAVFSVIDSTQRTVGAASLRVNGRIDFQNAPVPVELHNLFTADNGAAMQVALNTAIPVAYLMQSGFASLRLKRVALQIDASDQKKQLNIDNVSVSGREVHAGDRVRLNVLLTGENGSETTRQVVYQVPVGAQTGPLYFTVADAGTTNLTDFRQILGTVPRTAGQLIGTVNNLHPNNKAYVRVWRPDPAFQLEGVDMPGMPPSAALILTGSQPTQGGINQVRNSRIAQIEIDGGDMVISGVKTIQVEVKE